MGCGAARGQGEANECGVEMFQGGTWGVGGGARSIDRSINEPEKKKEESRPIWRPIDRDWWRMRIYIPAHPAAVAGPWSVNLFSERHDQKVRAGAGSKPCQSMQLINPRLIEVAIRPNCSPFKPRPGSWRSLRPFVADGSGPIHAVGFCGWSNPAHRVLTRTSIFDPNPQHRPWQGLPTG